MLLRHVAKTVSLPVAHRLGLFWLANRLTGGARRIALNYHNVDPAVFERHAAYLARTARVLPVDEFLSAPEPTGGPPHVALTFDDGYASFVTAIVPVLARHGLSAAWFVPTALVDRPDPFWFDRVQAAVATSDRSSFTFRGTTYDLADWNRAYVAARAKAVVKAAPEAERIALAGELVAAVGEPDEEALAPFRMVSREALAALDPAVVTIGSHSHTHPQLSSLDEAGMADEVERSRRLLEEWTGRPVLDFAYPSGDHDERVVEAVRAAGYRSAWTTRPGFVGPGDPPLRLPRIAIDDHAPIAVLAAKMTPLIHRTGVLR